MAQWIESEHPRDNDGKFTDKGAGASLKAENLVERAKNIFGARKVEKINGKSYNASNNYKEAIQRIKVVAEQRKNINTFGANKVLWAKFYNKLAEIQYGGSHEKTESGNIKITIEHKGIFYTILYNGDFVNPKILSVIKH